jgi:hypothetical protein
MHMISIRALVVAAFGLGGLGLVSCGSGSNAQDPGTLRTVVPAITTQVDTEREELQHTDPENSLEGVDLVVEVYINGDGSISGQGELRNERTEVIGSVDVLVTFLNDAGDVLAAGSVPAEPDNIAPGEKAFFAVFLPSPPEGIVAYAVQLVEAQ